MVRYAFRTNAHRQAQSKCAWKHAHTILVLSGGKPLCTAGRRHGTTLPTCPREFDGSWAGPSSLACTAVHDSMWHDWVECLCTAKRGNPGRSTVGKSSSTLGFADNVIHKKKCPSEPYSRKLREDVKLSPPGSSTIPVTLRWAGQNLSCYNETCTMRDMLTSHRSRLPHRRS